MKAEELMIGDWVKVTCEENCPPVEVMKMLPKFGRVVGIDGDTIYVDFVDFGFMLCDVEPIRITPAILEKNGFVPHHNGGVVDHYITYDDPTEEYEVIRVAYYGGDILDVNACGFELNMVCKHIHQLQHALRLCGIEKEIQL